MNKGNNQNLINFLKLFKNRPYHLAKYLIDNSALTDKFLSSLSNSSSLSKISEDEESNLTKPINFISISQMEDFYSSLLDEKDYEKTHKELEIEMNNKLDSLIEQEKYEEAAHLRDWMKRKKLKRNSK
jgi:hypothetical protein